MKLAAFCSIILLSASPTNEERLASLLERGDLSSPILEALAEVAQEEFSLVPLMRILSDSVELRDEVYNVFLYFDSLPESDVAALVTLFEGADPELEPYLPPILVDNGSQATTLLVGALGRVSKNKRLRIMDMLGEIGVPDSQVLTALRRYTNDDDFYIRYSALIAILNIDPSDRSSLLKVLELEKTLSVNVRRLLAPMVFRSVDSSSNENALANLLHAMENGSPQLAIEASRVLSRLGEKAVGARATLLKYAESDNPELSSAAYFALGEIFPNDSEIQDAIRARDTRVLSLEVTRLREAAAASDMPLSELIEALSASDPSKVDATISILIADYGKLAIPQLVKALDDGSFKRPRNRNIAVALSKFGHDAHPALIEMLESGTAAQRTSALIAITDAGPEAVPVLPYVRELLSGSDEDVLMFAVQAIGWMGPSARVAESELMLLLRDPLTAVRGYAAIALGQIQSRAAVPQLESLLTNELDPWVRDHAEQSLDSLR